jgi:hypothetical protein
MAIRVNGKDMKDAVIKTDQYEMKILDLTPDLMRVSITETYGDAFNFVPRFISMVYPDSKTITAKNSGAIVVAKKQTMQATIQFAEKLRIEMFASFEFRYAGKRLAIISIE